jgi:Ca-activated chloride channel homolog
MRLLSSAAIAAVLLALPGASQESSTEGTATFRTDTRLVVLHATVVDRGGKLIPDLKQEAFTVFENGQPQELKIFRREDIPVSFGLVIDNSGSMRGRRKQVETAALELVKGSKRLDEAYIVNFNDDAFLDVPMTSDVSRMEQGISQIDSRGGTAMRDAIWMSIDYMLEKAKRDKKVILVITDGDDNTSHAVHTMEKLVVKAQQSEVLIYCIGILGEEERGKARRAQRALRALAAASGGNAYFPETFDEVQEIGKQVAEEIRNQYTLAYTPTGPDDGSFRQIRVTVKGAGRATVRTRSGYYARKVEASTTSPAPPSSSFQPR